MKIDSGLESWWSLESFKMKTLKVGIMSREKFQKRILSIANGSYIPKKHEPKIWFSSIKSLSEVLSENNIRLLGIINTMHPTSIQELARITH